MPSRFNACVMAFVLLLCAVEPQFYASPDWWPREGIFLFASFVFTVIGFVQEHILGSVIMLLLLFVAGPFQMFVVPFMHAAKFGHGQEQQALVTRLADGDDPSSTSPAHGRTTVTLSQQAAIRKYPALAVRDSPMNTAFVARYTLWKQRDDPRLRQPNWPEVVADDCAANP